MNIYRENKKSLHAKEQWKKAQYITKWNNNPIDRYRYCLHEYQWDIFNTKISINSARWFWIQVYFGLIKR